jgi:large subunit ribosomal protein L4
MIKLDTYSSTGTKSSVKTKLPSDFDEKKNLKLLAQAIRVYQDRKHPGTSKTKTRGEIKISTRKIYRQKGTGMARHGAKSAPIFVGGSKAHGPDGLKRTLTLPNKMKKKALGVALSIKAEDDRVVVVSDIAKIKKTKEAATLVNKITKSKGVVKKQPKVTLVLSNDNLEVTKAFRNIKNLDILPEQNINALSVYYGGLLLVDKNVFVKGKSGIKSKK